MAVQTRIAPTDLKLRAAATASAAAINASALDLKLRVERAAAAAAANAAAVDREARFPEEALAAIGRDAIVVGHGLGGLLALALAERAHVRAAIALAPALPGFPSPLLLRITTLFALLRRRPLAPPRGRLLASFIANAETFQRKGLIDALVPDAGRIALECAGAR